MKIAVFCPNLIGDTVMATPSFRALRRGFPDAILTAVIKPRVAPTLDGTTWFDELIGFDSASGRARRADDVGREEASPRAVRHGSSFPELDPFRLDRLACGHPAPGRICPSWARHAADRPFAFSASTRPDDGSPLRSWNLISKLARRLGCPVDSVRTELATTGDDEASADVAWSDLGLHLEERVVCLNTGGAFGPAKNWPSEHFAELARRLAQEAGVAVLVLCGPDERALAREIAAMRPDIRAWSAWQIKL